MTHFPLPFHGLRAVMALLGRILQQGQAGVVAAAMAVATTTVAAHSERVTQNLSFVIIPLSLTCATQTVLGPEIFYEYRTYWHHECSSLSALFMVNFSHRLLRTFRQTDGVRQQHTQPRRLLSRPGVSDRGNITNASANALSLFYSPRFSAMFTFLGDIHPVQTQSVSP